MSTAQQKAIWRAERSERRKLEIKILENGIRKNLDFCHAMRIVYGIDKITLDEAQETLNDAIEENNKIVMRVAHELMGNILEGKNISPSLS